MSRIIEKEYLGTSGFGLKKATLIITRSHAWFAERFIRTFKLELFKRIENSKKENVQWTVSSLKSC